MEQPDSDTCQSLFQFYKLNPYRTDVQQWLKHSTIITYNHIPPGSNDRPKLVAQSQRCATHNSIFPNNSRANYDVVCARDIYVIDGFGAVLIKIKNLCRDGRHAHMSVLKSLDQHDKAADSMCLCYCFLVWWLWLCLGLGWLKIRL